MDKVLKCIDCNYMQIEIMDEQGGARARCKATSKPKAGMIITWAIACLPSIYDHIEGNPGPQTGTRRVLDILNNSQKIAPYWCPKRKGIVKK